MLLKSVKVESLNSISNPNLQVPSSSVAKGLKLLANELVHPKTIEESCCENNTLTQMKMIKTFKKFYIKNYSPYNFSLGILLYIQVR